jgi:Cu(I)/Ag(I) efflux system membrane fusion protein
LHEGLPVSVVLPAFPDLKFEGEIGAINPSIDAVKRTATVRVDVPNPDWKLRPGMYADVVVNVDAGEGLAIPFDSVLPTGSRMLVFVDKGSGKLEPRCVQVGRQFVDPADPSRGRYYQLTAGLRQGDRIVSGANFLIDAEAQIQGALKDFEDTTTPTAER